MSPKVSLSTLLISFTILLPATQAFAGIQNYRVPQIATTLQQCQAYEQSVVDNFKRQTNTKILSHSCSYNPAQTMDLTIEFAHPSALKLVSTYSEFSNVTGLYDDAQDCLANRDSEVARFRAETGLEPVVAYCFNDYFQEMKGTSWTLRIDAFGEAKRQPFTIDRHFYSPSDADPAVVKDQITNALATTGATGINVRLSRFRDATDLMILYYSSKESPLVEYSQGYFASMNHCEHYRETMREMYARAGGQTATFLCFPNSYSSGAKAFALGTVTQPLASDLSSTTYASYQNCEAKRAETETSWREGLEREIVGSICARESIFNPDDIRMRLFWIE